MAAKLATEVLPKFSSRTIKLNIVGNEKYDPTNPLITCIEYACPSISEVDVGFGMTKILDALESIKRPIVIVDAPELAEHLVAGSRAVARFGHFSIAFTSYLDSVNVHKLDICCWYRAVEEIRA